jgi:hypothetical protein
LKTVSCTVSIQESIPREIEITNSKFYKPPLYTVLYLPVR